MIEVEERLRALDDRVVCSYKLYIYHPKLQDDG